MHDDVAKSITVMELQRAKEEWMCHTLYELYDKMELWGWDDVQHKPMGKGPKSEQPGERPTDVVYRGYGTRRKKAQLGNRDKITA